MRKMLGALCAVCCVVWMGGCTAGQMIELGPQSHFVYPNSNVRALGPVRVKEMISWNLFIPPGIKTGAMDEELYNEALKQQPGADVIIDYAKIYVVKFPLVPFVYWTEVVLEGTAAKMEVGRQVLK